MFTRYRVHESNVAWRIADDEAVVLHANSSAYFGMNEVGTAVWVQLAEHPVTLETLTSWARSVFDDPDGRLGGDLSTFVKELVELDLVATDDAAIPAVAELGSTVAVASAGRRPWTTPAVERFGELEKLILSGE